MKTPAPSSPASSSVTPEQVRKLTEMNTAMAAAVKQSAQRITELKAEVKRQGAAAQAARDEADELRSKVRTSDADTTTAAATNPELAGLLAQVAELRTRAEKAEAALASVTTRASALEAELSRTKARQESVALSREKVTAAAQKAAESKAERKIASLEAQVRRLADEVESTSLDYQQAVLEKEIAEVMSAKHEALVGRLRGELRGVREDLAEARRAAATATSAMDEASKTSSAEDATESLEQCAAQNTRLRAALQRLRDIGAAEKAELMRQLRDAQRAAAMLPAAQADAGKWRGRVQTLEEEVNELKEQLDDANAMEGMLEALSENNTNLNEQVDALSEAVQDLEELRDVADEIEMQHVQYERELEEKIASDAAAIAALAGRERQFAEQIASRDRTIARYRELGRRLQAERVELQEQLAATAGEGRDRAQHMRRVMEVNQRLQDRVRRARQVALKSGFTNVMAHKWAMSLRHTLAFSPPRLFGDCTRSIRVLESLTSMARTESLLRQLLMQGRMPSADGSTSAEDVDLLQASGDVASECEEAIAAARGSMLLLRLGWFVRLLRGYLYSGSLDEQSFLDVGAHAEAVVDSAQAALMGCMALMREAGQLPPAEAVRLIAMGPAGTSTSASADSGGDAARIRTVSDVDVPAVGTRGSGAGGVPAKAAADGGGDEAEVGYAFAGLVTATEKIRDLAAEYAAMVTRADASRIPPHVRATRTLQLRTASASLNLLFVDIEAQARRAIALVGDSDNNVHEKQGDEDDDDEGTGESKADADSPADSVGPQELAGPNGDGALLEADAVPTAEDDGNRSRAAARESLQSFLAELSLLGSRCARANERVVAATPADVPHFAGSDGGLRGVDEFGFDSDDEEASPSIDSTGGTSTVLTPAGCAVAAAVRELVTVGRRSAALLLGDDSTLATAIDAASHTAGQQWQQLADVVGTVADTTKSLSAEDAPAGKQGESLLGLVSRTVLALLPALEGDAARLVSESRESGDVRTTLVLPLWRQFARRCREELAKAQEVRGELVNLNDKYIKLRHEQRYQEHALEAATARADVLAQKLADSDSRANEIAQLRAELERERRERELAAEQHKREYDDAVAKLQETGKLPKRKGSAAATERDRADSSWSTATPIAEDSEADRVQGAATRSTGASGVVSASVLQPLTDALRSSQRQIAFWRGRALRRETALLGELPTVVTSSGKAVSETALQRAPKTTAAPGEGDDTSKWAAAAASPASGSVVAASAGDGERAVRRAKDLAALASRVASIRSAALGVRVVDLKQYDPSPSQQLMALHAQQAQLSRQLVRAAEHTRSLRLRFVESAAGEGSVLARTAFNNSEYAYSRDPAAAAEEASSALAPRRIGAVHVRGPAGNPAARAASVIPAVLDRSNLTRLHSAVAP